MKYTEPELLYSIYNLNGVSTHETPQVFSPLGCLNSSTLYTISKWCLLVRHHRIFSTPLPELTLYTHLRIHNCNYQHLELHHRARNKRDNRTNYRTIYQTRITLNNPDKTNKKHRARVYTTSLTQKQK